MRAPRSVVAALALAALLFASCRGHPLAGVTRPPAGGDAGGETIDRAPDGADVAIDAADVAIDAAADADAAAGDGSDAPPPDGQCVNLECRVTSCTTIRAGATPAWVAASFASVVPVRRARSRSHRLAACKRLARRGP